MRSACTRSNAKDFPTRASPRWLARMKMPCVVCATRSTCIRCTSASLPARRNSRRRRLTCTRTTRKRAKPIRNKQGIEFDYCCVHAAHTMLEDGFETIMGNCNPETVSTDYDTSDRLYFEPLTLEDVLEIIQLEKPKGVIVQYGGQTPLKLARAVALAGWM